MEYTTLNNGIKMALVGFGTYQLKGKNCTECVLQALENGYRLIDTAALYENEKEVGEAIKQSDLPRKEIFLTTKVWTTDYGYEKTKSSVENSLKKLNTEYIDLVLLHQGLSDYYSAYRALQDLYKQGKIRAIGVSNFSAERMLDIAAFNEIMPAVNQVETHIFWQQHSLNTWAKKYNIHHQSWGPLAQHRIGEVVSNPLVKAIADKYGKTPLQIALKFNVQRGISVIPKTSNKERMKENINLFDFKLSKEDIKQIKTLDENKSMWCAYDNPRIVELALEN